MELAEKLNIALEIIRLEEKTGTRHPEGEGPAALKLANEKTPEQLQMSRDELQQFLQLTAAPETPARAKVYGYCRISRKEQNIERQVRNILQQYPAADLRKEAYTGTKVEGRKQFEKLLKEVRKGDTVVFDSVSRMSRNAEDGTRLYFELFNKGVNLVFLKERHIDTEAYKEALKAAGVTIGTDGSYAGDLVADITAAITKFMRAKAADDIKKAFDQAQKEVDDLHQRTKEGIETVRRNNEYYISIGEFDKVTPLGRPAGRKEQNADGSTSKAYTKAETIKQEMRATWEKYAGINDNDCMKLVGISRGTYYKYKKEIAAELEAGQGA